MVNRSVYSMVEIVANVHVKGMFPSFLRKASTESPGPVEDASSHFMRFPLTKLFPCVVEKAGMAQQESQIFSRLRVSDALLW